MRCSRWCGGRTRTATSRARTSTPWCRCSPRDSTRRGRRGAYVHYDGVNRRLRARRGARLAALTSGGAIPDIGDYRVILEPTETFVGTLNEDFAIESMPGDIFQLGNRSYLIQKIESGQVRVVDAQGQPPSIPFWLGEAPGRTPELSQEVSRLRRDMDDRLGDLREATAWLAGEIPGVPEPAARQMVEYLDASKKVPTPLQRMDAEDLVAAVFPDQLACPENLVGDREIPDHPLVQQTIADCLLEAMDFPGLKRVLEGMAAGRFTLVARDTTEPSPLAHEVINAKPYAFLDDAPLEERRTQAVITRRGLDVKTAEELGKLDQAAIDRVKDEAWPEVGSADELHDALLVMGAIPNAEVGTRNAEQQVYLDELARSGRAGTLLREPRLCVAAERLPMLEAVFPGAKCEPALSAPERDRARTWTREDALRELVRGRLEVVGPTTAEGIAAALGVPPSDVDFALGALEHEGFVLRGQFTPGIAQLEWCERRLLARIHRYTLDRLRQEIEPVSAADFMRFLLRWQRLTPGTRAAGPDGLAAVLELLDGFELPAGAWETDVLPARVGEYDPLWLDGLCLSGEIAWGRLNQTRNAEGGTRNRKSGPIRTTPVALFRRERGAVWRSAVPESAGAGLALSHPAAAVLQALDERGASFFGDLVNATGLLRNEVEKGLGELVACGLMTADNY